MTYPASTEILSAALSEANSLANNLKATAQSLVTQSAAGLTQRVAYLRFMGALSGAISRWATIAAMPGMAAYAQEQFGNGALNVAAEFTTMRNAAIALRDWIANNFPKDATTGVQFAQVWNTDGTITNLTFTSAQLAQFRTEANAFIATISQAVAVPNVIDADTGVDGTSAGVTVTPAGGAAASGEVVYVAICWVANSAGAWPTSYTLSGFTQIARVQATGNFNELVVFRKVAGASEPTSYTVAWTGGTFYNVGGACVVVQDADNSTSEGTPVTTYDSTSDTSWVIPALTTTQANSLDLAFVASAGDVQGSAGPVLSSWGSSFTEHADNNTDYAAIGIASAARVTAGSQAQTSVTGTSQRSLAVRVEVFEAGGSPPAIRRKGSLALLGVGR